MGLLKAADTAYAFRFLRLLTMPWTKTEAYKTGVINNAGDRLKKPETKEEKASYTIFHRLVFNVRRLLAQLPLGKSTIARYVSAFWLIKEHTDLTDEQIQNVIQEAFEIDIENVLIQEDKEAQPTLKAGDYLLMDEVALPETAETLAHKNTRVSTIGSKPVGTVFGISVYPVYHHATSKTVFVTEANLQKENTVAGSVEGRPMSMGRRGSMRKKDKGIRGDKLEKGMVYDAGEGAETEVLWIGKKQKFGRGKIRWMRKALLKVGNSTPFDSYIDTSQYFPVLKRNGQDASS